MTIDEMGNLYLTGQDITVYDTNGVRIASIAVPEPPANLAFGGADETTLFITARNVVVCGRDDRHRPMTTSLIECASR